jgi:hypothetical protein
MGAISRYDTLVLSLTRRLKNGALMGKYTAMPEAITQGQTIEEAARHSIYQNTDTGKRTSVPRHSEIDNTTSRKICAQLDVLLPR